MPCPVKGTGYEIGSMSIIKGARNTASSRGCSRIDALALPGDRDTKNLFERNGLTARLIVASSPL